MDISASLKSHHWIHLPGESCISDVLKGLGLYDDRVAHELSQVGSRTSDEAGIPPDDDRVVFTPYLIFIPHYCSGRLLLDFRTQPDCPDALNGKSQRGRLL